MNEYKITRFSSISNVFFLISCIFSLSFAWINFNIKSLKVSLISSIIITITFSIIYILFYKYKKTKTKENQEKNSIKRNLCQDLFYMTNKELYLFLSEIYDFSSYIKISERHLYSEEKSIDIFFIFDTTKQSNNIFQDRKSNNLKIFCINSIDINNNIENINIEFIQIDNIVNKLKEKNINYYPKYNFKKRPKFTIKSIFCIVLDKEKSKNYFLFAILLLFSSLFTPYSIYYIIFSTILFLLSIFSRFSHLFIQKN